MIEEGMKCMELVIIPVTSPSKFITAPPAPNYIFFVVRTKFKAACKSK
jgi:hypothetical protein